MSRGTKDFPQFGLESPSVGTRSAAALEAEFWAFVRTLREVADVSSIHMVAAGTGCSERSRGYAVLLHLHDWLEVDQAIRNVGSWLVAHDLSDMAKPIGVSAYKLLERLPTSLRRGLADGRGA
jgi:hypothetical protein